MVELYPSKMHLIEGIPTFVYMLSCSDDLSKIESNVKQSTSMFDSKSSLIIKGLFILLINILLFLDAKH